MSDLKHDPDDLAACARELLAGFLEEANRGQVRAIAIAAKEAVTSEKAAPIRRFLADLDETNHGLLTRAARELSEHLRTRRSR